MSTNDTREEHAPSSVASKPELSQEDRSARIAVTVFPLIIIAAFALGLIFPTQAAKLASGVNIGLGIIMFGMGLTLTLPDFALVVKRPLPVIVGVIAQYVIMPGVAFLLTKVLNLDPAIAAGVILVGCAPGGTASNVISYLAKGDVALSVTMTSISTLLAPLMTPLLTKWLAGQYMPVDAKSMALAIVQIVLIPVIAGIVVRMLAGRYVEKILPALPWISVLGISYVLAAVVGKSADKIMEFRTHRLCCGYPPQPAGLLLRILRRPYLGRRLPCSSHDRNRGWYAELGSGSRLGNEVLQSRGRASWRSLLGVAQPFRCAIGHVLPSLRKAGLS